EMLPFVFSRSSMPCCVAFTVADRCPQPRRKAFKHFPGHPQKCRFSLVIGIFVLRNSRSPLASDKLLSWQKGNAVQRDFVNLRSLAMLGTDSRFRARQFRTFIALIRRSCCLRLGRMLPAGNG